MIIFVAVAPTPPDLPVWRGDDTNHKNEINNEIYHAQNNAEDIVNMRTEGFLVDDNNKPSLKNILYIVPVVMKDNGLPFDQERGWDNSCN